MAELAPTTKTLDPDAVFKAAVSYAKSNHYLRAARTFRRAALLGQPKAMFYLGVMYAKGQGVPQSPYYAYVWLNLACLWNSSEAQAAITNLEKHLTTKEIFLANKLAAEKQENIFESMDAFGL